MASESSSGTLAKAAEEGNVAELRRLRVGEAGGEPVDATDRDGMTALHWAAWHGRLKAVQYLLQHGATVNVPGYGKYTALHLAAGNGHAAVARELVLHGADPRLTDGDGDRGCDRGGAEGQGRRTGRPTTRC